MVDRTPHATPEAERQAALDACGILDSAPDAAFDGIVRLATLLCATPAGAISLVDRDRLWFKSRIGVDQVELPRAQSLCDDAVRERGRVFVVEDLGCDPLHAKRRRVRGELPGAYAGVPITGPGGHAVGVLCVVDVVARPFTAEQVEGLELLGAQASQLLELHRLTMQQQALLSEREATTRHLQSSSEDLQRRHEALLQSAQRDPLTGLLNRSAMEELLAAARAREPAQRVPYSLVILDLDHFKQVNDRHGHLAGDAALRALGNAVLGSVRKQDIAVRFGGEEVVVYLPDTPLAGAAEAAHRIRELLAQAPLPFALTVSVGIAAGDPMRDTPEEVFERADQALYRAKAGGRDRVVVDDTPRF